MAGDTANAALWQNADVYIAAVNTAGPSNVTAAWGTTWSAVGLLDGEAGFVEKREDESNDFYAWGSILVKRTRSKHKRSITFTCLEDNLTTFGLVNPGSTRTTTGGVTTSKVTVPAQSEFAIGFEARDGVNIKRRAVKRAMVDSIADVTESEGALTVYEVTVVLYPEADGTIYTEIAGTVSGS